ncbi:MAG: dTDP-4-amino-4,6-dideoxygalactose transaminase, partial [Deltaproteobacteria bacterium]
TVNAFLLRGARIRFADVDANGNLDPAEAARLVSARTRAVVPVHYGGHCCDLVELQAGVGNTAIVEDAAHAIGASFRGRPLGTFGVCGAISFHETKNVGCGEGGAIIVRDGSLLERAEILRDKGNDRQRFERGLVDRYTWVDIGSSYTLSELSAAWLCGQLEQLSRIQARRQEIWDRYFAHLEHMREQGICCAFHYVALHTSPMGRQLHDGRPLPGSERLSSCLVRLPLFFELTDAEADQVIEVTLDFLRRL